VLKTRCFSFYADEPFLFLTSLWDAVNVFGSPIEGDLVTTGTPLGSPPLIEMMSNDPILRDVKVLFFDFFLHAPLEVFSDQ
jgi:hypothetical protein